MTWRKELNDEVAELAEKVIRDREQVMALLADGSLIYAVRNIMPMLSREVRHRVLKTWVYAPYTDEEQLAQLERMNTEVVVPAILSRTTRAYDYDFFVRQAELEAYADLATWVRYCQAEYKVEKGISK